MTIHAHTAPPFLDETARRDWQQLYDQHYCPIHPPTHEPHYCPLDLPEQGLPHACSIRALLEDDRVIRRWAALRYGYDAAELTG